MKHLASTSMLLLFCFITATSFSQTGKSSLFAAYPNSISCSENELSTLFSKVQGEPVSIQFGAGLQFTGTVVSNRIKYSDLQSIIIRSAALHNTILQVSKRTLPGNGGIVYIGRIINESYTDGFELRRDADGSYQLTKIETARVMPVCNQQ